jgi:hypothetical protein
MIRDGRSVVASIVELVLRDEGWRRQMKRRLGIAAPSDRKGVIEAACDWWNEDVRLSATHFGAPLHAHVYYSDLVGKSEETMRGIAAFLGITYVSEMTNPAGRAQSAIGWRSTMAHMQGPFRPIYDDGLAKFETVFDAGEQARITRRLVAGGDVAALMAGR